jgi:hypothetical protein
MEEQDRQKQESIDAELQRLRQAVNYLLSKEKSE